jgi:hypothetical protein
MPAKAIARAIQPTADNQPIPSCIAELNKAAQTGSGPSTSEMTDHKILVVRVVAILSLL